MDSCYSGGHNAEDHIYTDIARVSVRIQNRSTAMKRSVIGYWGIKHVILDYLFISFLF